MQEDFLLESYDYFLPKELIANYPATPRESAKLMVYDRKKDEIFHTDFYHIFDFIPQKALVVLNDTKVIKARIYGHKPSGGSLEFLYHREIGQDSYLVQIKGRVKENLRVVFADGYESIIKELREDGYRVVSFFHKDVLLDLKGVLDMLEKIGHTPLPPYIKRVDEKLDLSEYQSVFAKNLGAVAAPTASLHFSDVALERLKTEFSHCFLTLHIGAGTFNAVEAKDIRHHHIHTERLTIPLESMEKIDNAKSILCIGTTALRSVEYYARLKNINKKEDLYAQCDIFLHPGNSVSRVNHLLTNFHLPKSSLIMLVSSMVGVKKCRELYEIAIANQYRFYSYGDGMLIL
ncbi:tRNA preQ1(34) S-adenosylmethionine ribosyltransferase-isomerase QueA [Helicobacter cappadocius]|uniref:S-adenosylmethionine:tRNA ribosyltransferase-isomerase n=1 Tax=Helicobacter cappadocius TaxID=3063998 RepID=A0AA90TA54_9HELI|nr:MULTISPECIES: tRNA preQ1(34) S-adenosylmethionine ribosyltransferase-isomerase QueA [unclassified Helicobacter]MDO7253659.1 tRNA preQ1(34) S-adenosylmethionine ribosyltransferase-isomerase QueA [Helicobacter sp. faydin-H75]MDP2539587.1 tRNA preQ1(34) S-adenosylmethionine ribosyltransferase-isomerase QueA [Helicobacter sp. faydin-H76]